MLSVVFRGFWVACRYLAATGVGVWLTLAAMPVEAQDAAPPALPHVAPSGPTSTIVVKSTKIKSRKIFQTVASSTSVCTSTCSVPVLTVAENKLLEVTSFSCQSTTRVDKLITGFYLTAVENGVLTATDFFVPEQTFAGEFYPTFAMHAQTNFIVPAGSELSILAAGEFGAEIYSFTCKIYGEMAKLKK